VKQENKVSFENRMEKLEQLVQKMETGVSSLEELLQDYEEGIKLAKALESELATAQAHMLEVKGEEGKLFDVSPAINQASFFDEQEAKG